MGVFLGRIDTAGKKESCIYATKLTITGALQKLFNTLIMNRTIFFGKSYWMCLLSVIQTLAVSLKEHLTFKLSIW